MNMQNAIQVEVLYALPHVQTLQVISVANDSSVEQAIRQSGVLEKHPEINLDNAKVGIWNKVVELTTVLRDKDRIEIYRPLIADPKEVRRKRAEEGKAMKKGGGDLPA